MRGFAAASQPTAKENFTAAFGKKASGAAQLNRLSPDSPVFQKLLKRLLPRALASENSSTNQLAVDRLRGILPGIAKIEGAGAANQLDRALIAERGAGQQGELFRDLTGRKAPSVAAQKDPRNHYLREGKPVTFHGPAKGVTDFPDAPGLSRFDTPLWQQPGRFAQMAADKKAEEDPLIFGLIRGCVDAGLSENGMLALLKKTAERQDTIGVRVRGFLDCVEGL